MRTTMTILTAAGAICLALPAAAMTYPQPARVTACFTPGDNCTGLIVDQINRAQHEILVQAFNFTSKPILRALEQAHRRGVDVEVILDKKHEINNSYELQSLMQDRDPVRIDDTVKTAHNKVMVFDRRNVVTGSFNFTHAAQDKNAENLVLIEESPALAAAYAANWRSRASVSHPAHPHAGGPGVEDENE